MLKQMSFDGWQIIMENTGKEGLERIQEL